MRDDRAGTGTVRADGPAGRSTGGWADARDGARDTLPILPAIVPFAALYGALATSRGFPVSDVLLASGTVYAGASQYLVLDMLAQGLGTWPILLAVLAVNFRHVLYSAAIGRRFGRFGPVQKALAFALLVDPSFAAAERRSRTPGGLTPTYYFAYASTVYVTWMAANVVGIVSGTLLDRPERYGLDFILPLYFLGVLLGFRTSDGFVRVLATAATASVLAHVAFGPPWHILAGSLAGLGVAAFTARPPGTAPGPDVVVAEPGS